LVLEHLKKWQSGPAKNPHYFFTLKKSEISGKSKFSKLQKNTIYQIKTN